MARSAILFDRWGPVDVLPGGHVVLLACDEWGAVEARIAGMHLRDTLMVLGPGSRTSFGFLFRVPMVDSVVESVLKDGTGLLHIDACRVKSDLSEFFSASGKPRSGMGHARGYGMGDGYGGDKANPPNKGGRWPTNLAFIHSPECRIVGSRTISTGVAHRTKSGGNTFGGTNEKPPMADMTYADDSGKEVIPAYECGPDCLVRQLDRQSGDRASTLTGRADPKLDHMHPSTAKTSSWFSGGKAEESRVYADSGGASRFYPQFKSTNDFLSWVTALIGEP